MKFKIKNYNPFEWHEWFAWHPVRVDKNDDEITYAWLEKVNRKFILSAGGDFYNLYKVIK